MKEKKPLTIITEDGITQVYDKDGNNLCKQLSIQYMTIEYDAASQMPVIEMRVLAPDLKIVTDDSDVTVKHEVRASV